MKRHLVERAIIAFQRKCPYILKEQVKDLAQDAMLIYIAKSSEIGECDEPVIIAWLVRTMSYLWLNKSKRDKRFCSIDKLQEQGIDFASPDNEAARSEANQTLTVFFNGISELDRDIVWKHRIEGYTIAEIAAQYTKTTESIKKRYQRAMAVLMRIAANEGG